MTEEISDVKAFALSAAVLYIKFLVCTMIQGRKAFAAGTRMAEDSKLPQAKNAPKQGFADLTDDHVRTAIDEEMRWKRIIQNDLESMPMAYVVFWSAISVGVSSSLTTALLLVYTVARVGHTVVYSQSLPYARMVFWIVGMACIVIGAVASALTALK
ncbi:hypothetical protein PHYSODRAFT_299427 [Phytophthora sojae]|uniref:Microsomal glutathione S-transferase 1 n=1 Tax=Phytophthora sojae (strain P6497) TaxID=1094619 RepID=G4Z8C8_PHYSP|nr:hypothetical protein PHYSODRAFT_299427 [Phytophthora sojae]EGZ21848.1 hypothetical protein PHYSODRAFT_299427 [Phytophthora sojae]|eukprot:XP_009524565.1 hypothetical protein PHYSODRAFT_299427 [Phytophthora sojae]